MQQKELGGIVSWKITLKEDTAINVIKNWIIE